jgi:hypothetical protein
MKRRCGEAKIASPAPQIAGICSKSGLGVHKIAENCKFTSVHGSELLKSGFAKL